jgi:inorganic pyrophosphatase/exopolyphosphatase
MGKTMKNHGASRRGIRLNRINYRLATTKDIGPLTEYRMAMLEEVGLKKNDLSEREMEELIQNYYKEHLCSGTFFAYVAESENKIIGISGLG